MVTIDLPWIPQEGTDEKVLVHSRTQQVVTFTDELAPDPPPLGLADMFSQEDMDKMRGRYTEYELLSGGA